MSGPSANSGKANQQPTGQGQTKPSANRAFWRKLRSVLGKFDGLRDWITAIAAVGTAFIAVTALVFSTPADFRAAVEIHMHGYSVSIGYPRGGDVRGGVQIRGRANIPVDWSLIVLVQTPDEFTYYLTSGGAVAINSDHTWTLGYEPLGSSNPQQRKNDINKPYRIYALVLDTQGQQQVQAAIAATIKSHAPSITLTALPHNVLQDIVVVNLRS
jgi:hypothetical protein